MKQKSLVRERKQIVSRSLKKSLSLISYLYAKTEERNPTNGIKSAKVVLSLFVETLLRHRSYSRFFHTSSPARSSVIRVSRTRSISKKPREHFLRAFRKLIGKALMKHWTLAANRRKRFASSPMALHTIRRYFMLGIPYNLEEEGDN